MSTTPKTNAMLRSAFLILSFLTVSTIALGYGVNPGWFAQTFLGIRDVDMNVAHILRAVMGLYLAFGVFWLVGAINQKYRSSALLTLAILCGGLVSGRILSLFVDGQPAMLLQVYVAIELAVLPLAIVLLRLPDSD